MTDPDQDLLSTTEGVDEGSADATVEDRSPAGRGAITGQVGGDAPGGDAPGGGPLDAEASPAPPVVVDAGPAPQGPGQQLEAGEG